jgi:hypothetical protein
MVGVFLNAHVAEIIGSIGITDAVHEFGGLRFLAFRLLSGDWSRHQLQCKVEWRVQNLVSNLLGDALWVLIFGPKGDCYER